jgi:hypothetical protein
MSFLSECNMNKELASNCVNNGIENDPLTEWKRLYNQERNRKKDELLCIRKGHFNFLKEIFVTFCFLFLLGGMTISIYFIFVSPRVSLYIFLPSIFLFGGMGYLVSFWNRIVRKSDLILNIKAKIDEEDPYYGYGFRSKKYSKKWVYVDDKLEAVCVLFLYIFLFVFSLALGAGIIFCFYNYLSLSAKVTTIGLIMIFQLIIVIRRQNQLLSKLRRKK